MRRSALIVLLCATLLAYAAPTLAQQDVYTYKFYDSSDKIIATYTGPLITNPVNYTFTDGFTLNVDAITSWYLNNNSTPSSVPPNISGDMFKGCFFVMGGYPAAYIFACRILINGGPPQGTEIGFGFTDALPTSPGVYLWGTTAPGQTNESHIRYYDGINNWYGSSREGTAAFAKIEIVSGTTTTYACTGFTEPFDTPISVKPKAQRVIPLKAQLLQGGVLVTDQSITGAAPVVEVSFNNGSIDGAVDVTDQLASAATASSGNSFSFDPDTGTWHFNLSTALFNAPGSYTVRLKSEFESQYVVSPTCQGTFVRQ